MKKMSGFIFILSAFLFCAVTSFSQSEADYLVIYSDTDSGSELKGYQTPGGVTVIKAKYRIAYTDNFYKMAIVVRDDGELIAIDRNENIILYPFVYNNGPDYVYEGLFRFVENDKIGFANLNGDKIIPAVFDFAEPFSEGLAGYAMGGKKEFVHGDERWFWTDADENGYINKSGQRFSKIVKTENDERHAWTKDRKHYLLDDKGFILKEIFDPLPEPE
jgi:hypothetical protein